MIDREKTIRDLENIGAWHTHHYEPFHYECAETIHNALELLKKQEPMSPVKVNRYMDTDENGNWYVPETYDCGNCGVELHDKANYCHLCGRAVKWK